MDLNVSRVIPSNTDAFEAQFFEEQVYKMQLKENHGICPNENKSTDEAFEAIKEERRYRQAMKTDHARRREDCVSAEKSFFSKQEEDEDDSREVIEL